MREDLIEREKLLSQMSFKVEELSQYEKLYLEGKSLVFFSFYFNNYNFFLSIA